MIVFAMLLQAASPLLPPLHGGPVPMTCPVGGETYSAWQASSWSTYGQRPDGKPYSYLPMPFPLPECPTNKLVVFDRFSPAEVTKLTMLIASPEYRRLINTDTSYFRAWWLASRIGRPPADALWWLLNAGWQVKGGPMSEPARPELARRYTEAFARGVAALPADAEPKNRAALLARGANAWRELGRFREAIAMLGDARQAVAALAVADRGSWAEYLDRLAAVVARKDAKVEPLDMIPPQEAAQRCRELAGSLATGESKLCAALPTGSR